MNNIVEQLRTVVEEPETFRQILEAGRTNSFCWLCVRTFFFAFVGLTLPLCLSLVRRHYGGARASADLLRGATLELLGREETFWRRLTWVAASLVLPLLAATIASNVVELYKYDAFPRAMVLRDVLDKVGHH